MEYMGKANDILVILFQNGCTAGTYEKMALLFFSTVKNYNTNSESQGQSVCVCERIWEYWTTQVRLPEK